MPRYKKSKPIPDIRRKCAGTGKIAKVEHRYIKLPIDLKKSKNAQDYEDLKGIEIQNYSSIESMPEDLQQEFVNSYTEDDFIKL